ncbi:GNAT family N-acetyltransferase [Ideonella sp. A 288]|uniref:GNAT family N-acetyltransferase n=1 Tax=Ideonella sp. A 288 TaxID=1962181 RepID=UPI0013037862|nr:GNAT family N-acetyltransferase [Ideonella sp. A 288]
MTNIQLIQSIGEFARLRLQWNALLSCSASDTIFLTWEWLFAWWSTYASDDDTLYILTVHDEEGVLIGVLPCYMSARRPSALQGVRTLRLIGDASGDSDYLDAILKAGREEEILDALWSHLNGAMTGWKLLQFATIPGTSPTLRWVRRMTGMRQVMSRLDSIDCTVTDLPDSWDAYLASLKPRFRTKVRATLRQLESGGWRLRSVDNPASLDTALRALFDLHGRRWAVRSMPGVFGHPEKRKFYEEFTRLFLEQGWLAFDMLERDSQIAACQLCFQYRNTLYLLQEGFDPHLGSESVGIGLRAMVLRKAVREGIVSYDFLAGASPHKLQWNAHVKRCHNAAFGPRTAQNALRLGLPVLMGSLRRQARAWLPDRTIQFIRRMGAM